MDALVFLMNNPSVSDALRTYTDFYKVLIMDKNQCSDAAKVQDVFDEIRIVTDIQDKTQLESVLVSIAAARKIRAVYGTYEHVVEMAGHLRETFSIPGMNHHQSLMVRSKPLMKQVLSAGGIRTAQGRKVSGLVDLGSFITKYKFPLILKPVAGAATKNTHKIGKSMDLLNPRLMRDVWKSKEWLAEMYIEGEEYHCDTVVVDGHVRFVSVAKYLFNCIDTLDGQKPFGTINFPSHYQASDVQYEIKKMNEQAIRCLGIKNAVCHMEVFIDSGGQPIFGEIAARIGGSPYIGECIKNTHGIDINQGFIDAELGLFRQEDAVSRPMFTGMVAFPSKKGKIAHISEIEEFAHIEGVKKVTIFNKKGDRISRQKSTSIRLGYIIIEDREYDRLRAKLLAAYDQFTVSVE